MIALAIETTSNVASIAIGTQKQIIDCAILNGHKTVGTMLIPTIEKIFTKNNLIIDKIDMLFVDLGPGSYTGIRMGGLLAKTISILLNKKYYGLYSLEILAKYYNTDNSNKILITVLDAKSNMMYIGVYNSKEFKVLLPPQLISYDNFFSSIKNYENPVIITHDSTFTARLNMRLKQSNTRYIIYQTDHPTAVEVLKLGFHKWENNENFIYEPVYLRKSYAEEKYNITVQSKV